MVSASVQLRMRNGIPELQPPKVEMEPLAAIVGVSSARSGRGSALAMGAPAATGRVIAIAMVAPIVVRRRAGRSGRGERRPITGAPFGMIRRPGAGMPEANRENYLGAPAVSRPHLPHQSHP